MRLERGGEKRESEEGEEEKAGRRAMKNEKRWIIGRRRLVMELLLG